MPIQCAGDLGRSERIAHSNVKAGSAKARVAKRGVAGRTGQRDGLPVGGRLQCDIGVHRATGILQGQQRKRADVGGVERQRAVEQAGFDRLAHVSRERCAWVSRRRPVTWRSSGPATSSALRSIGALPNWPVPVSDPEKISSSSRPDSVMVASRRACS